MFAWALFLRVERLVFGADYSESITGEGRDFEAPHGILHHAGGIRHEDVVSNQHLHLGEAVSSAIDHI